MGVCRVRTCGDRWTQVLSLVEVAAPDPVPGLPELESVWVWAAAGSNTSRSVIRVLARAEVCDAHAARIVEEQEWRMITSDKPAPATWLVPA